MVSSIHPSIYPSLYRYPSIHPSILGLYQRDLYVMKTVVTRGVPLASVIGGGYSRDINKLALRHSIVHRAATQVQETLDENDLTSSSWVSLRVQSHVQLYY